MSDAAINQITTLIVKGIAKGATAIAQATVRTIDLDHNALDVAINGALPTGANTIGAVTAPGAAALALNATLTDATQRAGVLGADGATIASVANGVPVTPGTSTLWDVKDRLTRALGILTGRDGTTAASASNGVPVSPETSSVWDVKDRAARILGLLIGYDGAAVTSATNALPIFGGILSVYASDTIAATGVQIKASAGAAYSVAYKNNTGNARYLQIHNCVGTPSAGAMASWSSASLATGTAATLQIGHTVFGSACPTAIMFVMSTSIGTYTATTDTACPVVL